MSEDQRGYDGPIAEDQSDEAYNRRRADGIICQIDRVFKLKATDLPLDPSPELWDELTSEETAFALLAQDEGLTSFAEMEVWLESHPDYTPSELGPGTGELKRLQQRLRSLKLEQLDATLKRRDSRRAARQSEERKVMFDLTTAPDYEMQRCTVGGRYDKMIKESIAAAQPTAICASHNASQGYPQPHTALNRPHLVANVVHLHGLTIPNITLPC